jgi:hypothetical protein
LAVGSRKPNENTGIVETYDPRGYVAFGTLGYAVFYSPKGFVSMYSKNKLYNIKASHNF